MSSPEFEQSLPETIEVRELPHGIRYTFPIRPLGWRRFPILFFSTFGGLAVLLFAAFYIANFFGHGVPGVFQLFIWMNLLLGAAFFVAGVGAIGAAIRFTFGRSEVEIDNGKIVARQRLGPLRWSRGVPLDQVRHLTVTIPSKKRTPRRCHARRAALVAMGDALKPTALVGGYPVTWLVPLAEDLARRWDVGATDESATSRRPTVEVVQTTGIEDLDLGEAIKQPPESRVRVAFCADGITLEVPPVGVQHDAGGLFLFAIACCGFLVVVTAFILSFDLRFAQIRPWHESVFVFMLLAVLWVGAVVLLTTGYRSVKNRAVFRVSDERLLVTEEGPSGRMHREWKRDDIALIGVGPTSPIDNNAGETAKVLWELQIYPKNARHVGLLAGRDTDELRWIATTLRWALRLPGQPVQT
jgi:hypothetical protein